MNIGERIDYVLSEFNCQRNSVTILNSEKWNEFVQWAIARHPDTQRPTQRRAIHPTCSDVFVALRRHELKRDDEGGLILARPVAKPSENHHLERYAGLVRMCTDQTRWTFKREDIVHLGGKNNHVPYIGQIVELLENRPDNSKKQMQLRWLYHRTLVE